jgi:putative flippase GtrA
MFWSGKYLVDLTQNRIIRYLVTGFFTTLISFGSFGLLITLTAISPHAANIISVLLAVVFAYFANKVIVFQSKFNGIISLVLEMLRFIVSRTAALVLEIAGVYVFFELAGLEALLAKALISLLVIVFNYLSFHYFVFRQEQLPENGHDGV